MRHRVFLVLLLAACRRELPTWARADRGLLGDATVDGDPAPVARFAAPPTIDGRLDEAVWQGAAVLGPFVDPGDGRPAGDRHPVAAWARLGWDDAHLYLGVVVRDRDPVSPHARGDADPHIWGDASGIELMVQPGDPGDNKDYFEIQIDVAGAVFDTRWDDYNTPIVGAGADKRFGHMDWSSGVERAVFVADRAGYAIEAALPFSTLAPVRVALPPRPGDVWRVNLYSFRDGQRAALAWSPIRRQGNFHRARRFGRIRF